MDQLTSYKHKIDFLISKDTFPSQPTQTTVKTKRKRILCNECNQKREFLDESHQICHVCFKAKTIYKPSGNRIIDDFIKYTLINGDKLAGKMEFVPYDRFKNVEFITEGGFSKIYKATWIDGSIKGWNDQKQSYTRNKGVKSRTVVLKKLNNSKEVTSKELNELKIFYEFSLKGKNNYYVSKYYGITQDPTTKDIMIVLPYYKSGDLVNYITSDFYNIRWKMKLSNLKEIIIGLGNIHRVNIIHRDFHSGNIFFGSINKKLDAIIGDLGLSKSATESSDDNNNENYGIIPYMAPEIFNGHKYTKESDIYSFGMIMWEFMTGRRPFWDRVHDAELIIEICDGLRPPIVTNAPEGYVTLMNECWDLDPEKRPTAYDIHEKIDKIDGFRTEIIESSDIGPVKKNNLGAIYKSRPLSGMIRSAMSTRSLRSQSITSEVNKRKFEDNPIENDINNGKSIKKTKSMKSTENEDNDYITQELDLDIDVNTNNNDEYITQEIDLDISI